MKIVVVESPAKAKTINKYLGDDYKVIASVGHVRDLPSKEGSVDPEQDFALKWEVSERSHEPISQIESALKGASKLILATDPDREGEAISWHVHEVLQQKKVIDGIDVERVVFNEITKNAILDAMQKPRLINDELVDAYLARRALDYLVGFGISPILWRKLPGARSAGRVQSVALKLICERESEIEAFTATEYWSVTAQLKKSDGSSLTAKLTHLGDKKLGIHELGDEATASNAAEQIRKGQLKITEIETSRKKRNPQPPFITSTLQQEASRKFGFAASRTMRIAQKLYEGINIGSETTGLITYMRTDGVQLGQEAITDIRKAIVDFKGDKYLPTAPRAYKSRAANAQEAHEAIRPTSIMRRPEDVASYLDDEQRKLYELIWRRTIASQMQSAELDMTSVDIQDSEGKVTLRATGSVIVFDGFLSVYKEDQDDKGDDKNAENGENADNDDNGKKILPPLAKGEALDTDIVTPNQHFTQPPPRYTDASLVKKMEELGIGRPSTYASILSVLVDRDYVEKDRRRFVPQERGRIVSAFLESFFTRYVEYGFTARLEEDLDRVSDGKLEWREFLASFWQDFKAQIDGMDELTRNDVLEKIDALLEPYFFPKGENGTPSRKCEKCDDGKLVIQLGKFGAFIGCSNYPECRYTRQPGAQSQDDADNDFGADGKMLGIDPETNMEIWLKKGPYGVYVQQGDKDTTKPKRSGLPKNIPANTIDLNKALSLLALPREIGTHPNTGEAIVAGIGRYGPYLKYGGNYVSLPADDTVLSIGINHAVEVIDKSGKTPAKILGKPEDGEVSLKSGRYGPYVQQGSIRATIPKSYDADSITLEEALELIAAKKAKPKKKVAKKAGKKSTKKKDQ